SSPRRIAERPVHGGAVIPSSDGDRRAAVVPGPARCELRTARLRLAPVAEHELEALLALHADPRAFAEDLTEPVTDRARMRWVLRRWRESWDRHGLGYLTVRSRPAADGTDGAGAPATGTADGAAGAAGAGAAAGHRDGPPPHDAPAPLPTGLLGVVGLTPLALEDGTVLSAYWRLAPEATGRGVASEAMRAVLAHPQLGGRAAGSGPEIIAVTAAGHRPPRTLAARLGFGPAPADRPVPGGRAGDAQRGPPGPSPLPQRSPCSLPPLPPAPAAPLPPPAATCTWATSAPRSSPGCWPAAAGAPSTCGSRISTGCARARNSARSRTWPRSGSTGTASWSASRSAGGPTTRRCSR